MDKATILAFGVCEQAVVIGLWLIAFYTLPKQNKTALWVIIGNVFLLLYFINALYLYKHIDQSRLLLLTGYLLALLAFTFFKNSIQKLTRSSTYIIDDAVLLILSVTAYWCYVNYQESQMMDWTKYLTIIASVISVIHLLFNHSMDVSKNIYSGCGRIILYGVFISICSVLISFFSISINLHGDPSLVNSAASNYLIGVQYAVLILTVLVFNISIAVTLATLIINSIEKHTSTDYLTKICNRKHMEKMLSIEISRSKRIKQHFSILMIDIDHFKRVNDTFGHPVGDDVLIQVAQTLKNTARQLDTVSRIGGEEFCIILPDTGIKGAIVCAERFRVAIQNLSIQIKGAPNTAEDPNQTEPGKNPAKTIKVTISTGIHCTVNDTQNNTSNKSGFSDTRFNLKNDSGFDVKLDPSETIKKDELKEILKKADAALYKAKNSGRNRFEIFKELTPPQD